MAEYILLRALFFAAVILEFALIIIVGEFGSSLKSRSWLTAKREKKAVIDRKSIPSDKSGSNLEYPYPAPAS